MKYVVSRYNHNIDWLPEYTDDIVLYDRSDIPANNSIGVLNLGSDIADKLKFIIDNYDNLPEIAVYTKANLFKYITREEFDLIKDNQTFTPILTKNHEEKMINMEEVRQSVFRQQFPDDKTKNLFFRLNRVDPNIPGEMKRFSFYENGIYNELNIPAYWNTHKTKTLETIQELMELVGIWDQEYVQFAPGSNYILPRENILKHSKEFYEKLRSYLDWAVYPGEAMILERALYKLWK